MSIEELTTLAQKAGCRSYSDVAQLLGDATGDSVSETAVRRWHKCQRDLPGWVIYVLKQELKNNRGKPLMAAKIGGRPGAFDEQN